MLRGPAFFSCAKRPRQSLLCYPGLNQARYPRAQAFYPSRWQGLALTTPEKRGGDRREVSKNVFVGGQKDPPSHHIWGKALDLVPEPVRVTVQGKPIRLDLHKVLDPTLLNAALSQVKNAGCEKPHSDGKYCDPDDPKGNHVHMQW